MKLLLGIAGSGALVGGLYAGDLLTHGDVHDLPLNEARARLIAMPLPRDMLLAAGPSTGNVSVTSDSSSVSWRIGGFEESAQFTARLEAVSAGRTRVTLEHAPTRATGSMTGRLTSTRFMRGFSDSSFSEAVDATLEGRAFSRDRSLDAFAQHQSMNPGEVKELSHAVRGMMLDVHNQLNQQISENSTPVVDHGTYGKPRPSLPVRPE